MNNPSLAMYRARWQRFYSQARTRWQALALREKRMVGGMAVVVVSLLVWVALIEPPLKKIAYWQAETPKLRAQTEALEVLLREVNVRPDGQHLEQALQQTLQASGLSGHFQLKLAQPGTWELSFDAAPADAVLDWLLSNPAQFSLQVVEARLQRADATTDDTAGTLSGTVRMDQALGAKEAS
ncbi:type II secretion system protein M [Pseudomonas sp. B2M1-30]|uniref:type II secretion system protein M n=1 Tax=Pseudomonas TaxID=286 RepID=UPI0021C8EF8E|nr:MULTISPECIES: type II secretion system protein M [Pseudomonas]MCU0121729.1 type II secretion system protein M [Pseudomonas sp. B2M1-30]MCU7263883.1 type II secretion system protein M [Pseudomonas koreensis]